MDEKKKKKTKVKKTKLFLYTLLVAVVILLIAFTAAQKLGNVTVSTMFANVKSYIMGMGSGEGYPYSIDAGSIKNIEVISNSNLLILDEDETEILTSTAKVITPKEHKYSNPIMKTNGSVAIVYDLDSGRFRIQNSSEITYEKELPQRIMAADIGKKGNYAVGTYGTDVQSVLSVCDSKNRQVFSWNFKTERISDISLSDNGKLAAVSTIYSENGKINSKLYIFNLKSDKYISCFDYPSSVLIKVDYINKTDVAAIGNNIRSFIKEGKTKTDKSFGSDTVRSYSISEKGMSAIACSKYGSSSISGLTVYDKNNAGLFSKSFEKEVKWVDCDGKSTAVLFENEVKTYDKKGKEIGSISFSGDPVRVIVDGSTTYVVTSVNIQSFKTKGTQTAQKAEG